MLTFNPYNAEIPLYKPWRSKGFAQFEILINVSVSSLRFISIPMLRFYDVLSILLILSVLGPSLYVRF